MSLERVWPRRAVWHWGHRWLVQVRWSGNHNRFVGIPDGGLEFGDLGSCSAQDEHLLNSGAQTYSTRTPVIRVGE